jgi:hypothetical protein
MSRPAWHPPFSLKAIMDATPTETNAALMLARRSPERGDFDGTNLIIPDRDVEVREIQEEWRDRDQRR